MTEDVFKCLKNAAICLVVFLFVFDCVFKHAPVGTNVFLSIIGMSIFPVALFNKWNINRKSMALYFLFFVMLLYAYTTLTFNNSNDTSFIVTELIRSIFLPYFSSFVVALILSKMNISFKKAIENIVLVSMIQCGIIFLAFLIPSINSFILSIQLIGERELLILEHGFRYAGLGVKFDYGSFTMSVVMICCVYLYSMADTRLKKNMLLFAWFVHMIAGMLLARSIIIGVLFSIAFLLLIEKDLFFKLKTGFKVAFAVVFFVLIILFVFPNFIADHSDMIEWMFQYVAYSSNVNRPDSLNTLFECMYFVPEYLKTFLIGDGFFQDAQGLPYMHTDPLIMRHILYWGVCGLILFFLFLFLLFQNLKKIALVNFECEKINLFFNILFLMIVTFYFKLNYHFFKFIFLFYWLFYLTNKNLYVEKKND